MQAASRFFDYKHNLSVPWASSALGIAHQRGKENLLKSVGNPD